MSTLARVALLSWCAAWLLSYWHPWGVALDALVAVVGVTLVFEGRNEAAFKRERKQVRR